jgi:hypothetical protein
LSTSSFASAPDDGTPSDLKTFEAQIRGTNVTRDFQSIVEAGQTTGMRAALAEPPLRIGSNRLNRIRFTIRSAATSIAPGSHPRTFRDDDHLRFRATQAADLPPSCKITSASGILTGSVAHPTGGRVASRLDEVRTTGIRRRDDSTDQQKGIHTL